MLTTMHCTLLDLVRGRKHMRRGRPSWGEAPQRLRSNRITAWAATTGAHQDKTFNDTQSLSMAIFYTLHSPSRHPPLLPAFLYLSHLKGGHTSDVAK